MPAFSQLARAQMRDPLGMLTDELQALEDLLGTPAIQDTTGIGAAAIEDLGGAVNGNAITADGGEDSDGMSEPTDAERQARQEQLDVDSEAFLNAIGLGIFDADGAELFSDNTFRPAQTRSRPPTPPVPTTGTEHYLMASGSSTPVPDQVESSPDVTPKRQRTQDAVPTEAILAQAAAALQSSTDGASQPSREPRRRVEKTLGKVRSAGTASPRTSSPRSVVASLSHGIQPTPKAPPEHLARARLAAEAAETATFGSAAASSTTDVLASPDRVVRDATMEERAEFVGPLPTTDYTPVRVVGVATPTPDEAMPSVTHPTADVIPGALEEPVLIPMDATVLAGMASQMEHMQARILEQAITAHEAERLRAADQLHWESRIQDLINSASIKERDNIGLRAQVKLAADTIEEARTRPPVVDPGLAAHHREFQKPDIRAASVTAAG